jgi:diketogulonate reductase-like aldo/keto reductase
MHTRRIPSSNEELPIIGCGTYRGFDVKSEKDAYGQLRQVLDTLFAAGGSVIDTSPMYGKAEAAAGDLLAESNAHTRAFIATKVWTRGREAGIAQMENSFELLKTDRIDLMQIHNLVDWKTHLRTLRDWKEAGRIRYLGITHYTSSAFADLEEIMRAEPLDFVQFNYSAVERAAERRLLPVAAERGIAVIANYPLASGSAVQAVSRRPVPDWASEIDCTSWSQLLLKFVIGHPAITCAIPGTGNPEHMADNGRAGNGRMPDEAMRKRIAAACAE